MFEEREIAVAIEVLGLEATWLKAGGVPLGERDDAISIAVGALDFPAGSLAIGIVDRGGEFWELSSERIFADRVAEAAEGGLSFGGAEFAEALARGKRTRRGQGGGDRECCNESAHGEVQAFGSSSDCPLE